MKTDFAILERKFKELHLEKKLQNEDLQKVNKEKAAVDSQMKESENLLIQEKWKIANLEKERVKSKEELQSMNVLLDEFKLSTREYSVNILFSQFKLNSIFKYIYQSLYFPPSENKFTSIY